MKPNKIFLAVFLAVVALFFSTDQDVFAQNMFIRGDVNCDGAVDSSDIVYLTAFIFSGGPAPPCRDAADLNDNGFIANSDNIYLVSFLYSGGPPPPAPFPLCGSDPTADALPCSSTCCPNHFKAYSIKPHPVVPLPFPFVKDQFMEDNLQVLQRVLLANPVQKDSFFITDTTHHLTWYFVDGRDTLIQVNYQNQYETTTVLIDTVMFLLVPTQKFPHAPPESLDHYKCYRIRQSEWLQRRPLMYDQFTFGEGEIPDSLRRDFFCTPCQKNTEPWIDTITHYVAYLIAPGQPFIPPLLVNAFDQFGTRQDTVFGSKYLLVPTIKSLPPPPPPDTGKNHYKTWRISPIPLTAIRQVKDQFMTDTLDIVQLEYLSNPVRKIVPGDPPLADTFHIVDQDDHLTWYRAFGRDTLLSVEYVNQFESTKVEIDSVKYLLLPAQKDGHLPPDSLDHYKAYRIRNPQDILVLGQLEDQFDRFMGTVENIDGMFPVFFLTPCQKENEPTYDMTTHYVAYVISPMGYSGPPRQITDQFLFQRTVDVFNSQFVLVPTRKKSVSQPTENCCFPVSGGFCGPVPVGTCVPSGGVVVPVCLGDGNGNGIDDACDPVTPPDTLRNHFKTWRVFAAFPVDTFAFVRDQFKVDTLKLDSLSFLSNPVRKIVFGPIQNDTSDITRPDDHLTWYRARGRAASFRVIYANQFETDTIYIDTVKYLLLPAQKTNPFHNPPDSLLGHYTAYKIRDPFEVFKAMELTDQFDPMPETITAVIRAYFLAPAEKNGEPIPSSDTHYVAYEIFPKDFWPITAMASDQFGLHHFMAFEFSHLLLVPTNKIKVEPCTHKPNDCSGDGAINLADIVCDVNTVFKGVPKPVPNCRCDSNGDGSCNLSDIVHEVNYVFKGGPQPVVGKECCIPVK